MGKFLFEVGDTMAAEGEVQGLITDRCALWGSGANLYEIDGGIWYRESNLTKVVPVPKFKIGDKVTTDGCAGTVTYVYNIAGRGQYAYAVAGTEDVQGFVYEEDLELDPTPAETKVPHPLHVALESVAAEHAAVCERIDANRAEAARLLNVWQGLLDIIREEG